MTNFHNTLYVTTDDTWIGREGESLKVRVAQTTKMQVPLHHLVGVVCLARASLSPDAMQACAEAGVSVAFLTPYGRFLARVEGPAAATATLRREQYRCADDPVRALMLARGCIAGKVANSRTTLLRAGRTRPEDSEVIDGAAERLKHIVRAVAAGDDLAQMRGLEGDAASRYFDAFDAMLGPGELRFDQRTRRPPLNEVNALLSFGYALLSQDCVGALQGAGLDPAVGFLHAERSGRPALACDLMEEFRAPVVDRMVLAWAHRKQIAPDDFERQPTGAVMLKDKPRKAFLVDYQTRKQEPVSHPALAEPVTWGMLPHLQARLLARAIRGEGEYVPYLHR